MASQYDLPYTGPQVETLLAKISELESEMPSKTSDLTNDSGFITSSDVPTKTSDLNNDSGFITNAPVAAEAARAQAAEALLATISSLQAEISRATGVEGTLQDLIDGIAAKIPSAATDQNQLADKAFVNSSIATASATFRGTYISLVALQAVAADENDYGYVISTDAVGNTIYNRYKYANSTWTFEYAIANPIFDSSQWAAINSAVTAELVAKLSALPDNETLTAALAAKQDVIDDLSSIRSKANSAYQKPAGGIPKTDLESVVQTSLGKADSAVQESAIADNLATDDATKVLSAKQGVVLAGQVSQLGQDVTDLIPLCTKRTGYYVNASSATPGSANFDYYTYKIDGEKKIRVYTKLQYSNNLPAYLLYSTDTITADGYITHTNWKSEDGVYEITIPDNCKLLVVNVYRPKLAEPTIEMDGKVYSQLLSSINAKIAETKGNVSAIDNRVTFLENISVDGVLEGTKNSDAYIKIDGDIQGSSSGSYYYSIPNKNYKKVFAKNGKDANTVAAIAFYNNSTPSASALISAIPFSYTTNERVADVPDNTVMIGVTIVSSFAGNEVVMLIPNLAGIEGRVSELENDVDEIRGRGNGVIPGDGSAAEVKELINATRPYYFAQGWADSDNFGYLDERLKLVPDGKHFLVYTDIHLDYYGNFGLSQKQSIIMKYVQKRLRDCNVVFLGDFIGTQPTELAAQKEMAWFAADNYSKFGDRFLPVLGDHDTDRVGGGLPQGSQLTEEYIYETYFKQAHIYGAVQDKAIPVIDTIAFSDDSAINATKRAAWKNYMRMHYYKDDDANKIRFISLQATGANFRSMPNNFNTPRVQLPFICDAIKTAPDDYDIVIVAHEYQIVSEGASVATVWEREMYKALTAFRNRTSYTISVPYSGDSEENLVWPYVRDEYPSTFDYSAKTGKIAVLQGDTHYDSVSYYNAVNNQSNPVGYGYTPDAGDVIRIIIDRATLVDDNGFPTSTYSDPLRVLRCYRRAVAQRGDVVLLGTTDEVLFDVITINDNGITLTRFGDQPVAGKVGLYPIFSEEESYEVGDKVVYYETIGSAYFPKAYTFISAHTPGAFNASEVAEFVVTEPYVRNYTL